MEPRGAAAAALLDLSEQTIDGPAVRPSSSTGVRRARHPRRVRRPKFRRHPWSRPRRRRQGRRLVRHRRRGGAPRQAAARRGVGPLPGRAAPRPLRGARAASACVALRRRARGAARYCARRRCSSAACRSSASIHAPPPCSTRGCRGSACSTCAAPAARRRRRPRAATSARLRRAAGSEIELDLAPTLQSRHASPDVVAALSAVAAPCSRRAAQRSAACGCAPAARLSAAAVAQARRGDRRPLRGAPAGRSGRIARASLLRRRHRARDSSVSPLAKPPDELGTPRALTRPSRRPAASRAMEAPPPRRPSPRRRRPAGRWHA